ncbi:MAG: HAD hydrolase family protein [Phycisphaerales bacterium]|jgi:hydroxymethylpyrimidine pyrophosphatase-like HAD family hydrolase|nr:HAD hydrolase family protein [Phycisphaerales bacterium]
MPTTPHHRFDAIVCDVDGCLSPELPRPTDMPRLAHVAVWNERAKAGEVPPLTLCTGRPLPFAEAVGRAVGAFHLPIVCEGGVWLLDLAHYTFERDPRITREHLRLIAQVQEWIAERWGGEGVFFEVGKAAAVTVFHPRGPDVLRASILPEIRDRIAREGWPLRVGMTWTCINVELDFVSKATGLDRLMARTGLTRDRLAGVGDTMSDLAIRERVAFFACPANADENLKPHADYVAAHEETAGVLEILDHLNA